MRDERARAAFTNTKLGALIAILNQRNPSSPSQQGSMFEKDLNVYDLMNAYWLGGSWRDIQAPAIGFYTTDFHGFMRVKSLAWVLEVYGPKCELTLLDGHKTEDNPRGSGFVSCVLPISDLNGPEDMKTNITTLIVGPSDYPMAPGDASESGEVVWTFFPGDPIPPSKVQDRDGMHGGVISAQVAQQMGFQYVKLA